MWCFLRADAPNKHHIYTYTPGIPKELLCRIPEKNGILGISAVAVLLESVRNKFTISAQSIPVYQAVYDQSAPHPHEGSSCQI